MENEVKKAIIEQKLAMYKQQNYSLELDLKIAKISEDDNLKKRVQTQLKTTLAALDVLEKELKALDAETA